MLSENLEEQGKCFFHDIIKTCDEIHRHVPRYPAPATIVVKTCMYIMIYLQALLAQTREISMVVIILTIP